MPTRSDAEHQRVCRIASRRSRMSSKINGMLSFDISSFEQVEQLPEQLASCSETAVAVWKAYWEGSTPVENHRWSVSEAPRSAGTPREQWSRRTGPHVERPGGVWLFPGPKCTHVATAVKWLAALKNAKGSLLEPVRFNFLSRLNFPACDCPWCPKSSRPVAKYGSM